MKGAIIAYMIICCLSIAIFNILTVSRSNTKIRSIQSFSEDSEEIDYDETEVFDVTYTSQSTMSRFFYIDYLRERWNGPVSIVLYIPQNEYENFLETKQRMNIESRISIALHLQVKKDYYPINLLRNIAIKNVKTSHFFMSDMDMWPSFNLYNILRELPTHIIQDDLFAGIIPAFEVSKPNCDSIADCVNKVVDHLPPDKPSLINCLKRKECFLYRETRSTHNYLYEKWFHTDCPYHYSLVPCWFNSIQEPYVVVKKSPSLPMFDERFVNYGFNKITWLHHLIRRGYYFGVISRGFVMDIPHPESQLRKRYVEEWNSNEGSSMLKMYKKFMEELNEEPDLTTVPICLSSFYVCFMII